MGLLGSIVISAVAAMLAVLAYLHVRRQGRRAEVRSSEDTETLLSHPTVSADRDDTAQEKGDNESPVQEAVGTPERELPEGRADAPASLPAPENRECPTEIERGADHQEPAPAEFTVETETPVAEESAEETVAVAPETTETARPLVDVSCNAEGEIGRAAAPQEPKEDEPEAQESKQAVDVDRPNDGASAGDEADANGHTADDDADGSAVEANEAATSEAAPDQASPEIAEEPEPGGNDLRPRRPTVHRDRRGKRRAPPPPAATGQNPPPRTVLPPAAALLRLALNTYRRTATLSLMLSRPEGFPERAALLLDGGIEVGAYDESRYDDIDIPWTSDLLAGELRINSVEGFRWVRSSRRVQIFAADPSEPDLVSVSAVRVGTEYALICRIGDVPAIRAIAQQAGSPELVPLDRWQGIPEGWSVLSGYNPAHATGPIDEAEFRPLDAGADVDITLGGGLALRPRVFAEGHPPQIEISPVPEGATVTIGGQAAIQNARGSWEAPGWDTPGQHIIDVVPGASATYEIAADPGNAEGWTFWNAHEELPAGRSAWSRAGVCGAMLRGAVGEIVLACETQSTMIALGANRGAVALKQRSDANVSVALLAEPPAFLVATSGLRRRQGKVIWLGQSGASPGSTADRSPDFAWADAVHAAAVRRLPLVGADKAGEAAWRTAVVRARNLRRRRR